MAYSIALADRVREFLQTIPELEIEEKKMFRGLAFLVNGKMCVNVSGDNLMCRFDPTLQEEVAERNGFQTMIMRGREFKGYCYVSEEGYKSKRDFEYWLKLCLSFNENAKASKKKKASKSRSGTVRSRRSR
ncbi:TfoX/Sxy family protein [Fulvivirgaceae bacterium PWU4]|uniref:TfoX/Sxy family protein n=1 Tax=Chryseosolibacter histidini TaxID=2782349 RepID=A0AAP2DK66_9BACT|nr:TfoX/Sxy family protein [Chryseosolibacter histidini]MBT1695369.1 TfoX/Sxy family protein [Chryseosolibacter histidini]